MAVQLKGLGNVSTVTAGTRVRITSSHIVTPGIVLQARSTNTAKVYVGGSDVDATHAAMVMAPGDSVEIVGPMIGGIEEEFDLYDIWLDSAANGEGITVGYIARKD